MSAHRTASSLLRRALQANGAFSALSGVVLIVAAEPLSAVLGLKMPAILIGIGAGLLVYAAALFRNALGATINEAEALLAVILDAAWVAGSLVLILAGRLSVVGNWMVAIIADIVLLFAVLQFYALRRIRKGRAASA